MARPVADPHVPVHVAAAIGFAAGTLVTIAIIAYIALVVTA